VLCARLGTLAPVVPVGVCAVPGPFHSLLRSYKDSRDPARRRRCTALLGRVLDQFWAGHAGCLERLAGRPLTHAALVPPRHRRDAAPMTAVVGATTMTAHPLVPALGHAAGRTAPAHLQADPAAFCVDEERQAAVRGRGIILFDDTLTTGASAQSAAVSLRAAGATAVVIVVLGRVVRPTVSATQRRYWELVARGARSSPACPGCVAEAASPKS
jgi:hypothetical protein